MPLSTLQLFRMGYRWLGRVILLTGYLGGAAQASPPASPLHPHTESCYMPCCLSPAPYPHKTDNLRTLGEARQHSPTTAKALQERPAPPSGRRTPFGVPWRDEDQSFPPPVCGMTDGAQTVAGGTQRTKAFLDIPGAKIPEFQKGNDRMAAG